MDEPQNDSNRKLNLLLELYACEPANAAEEQLSTTTCRVEKQESIIPDQELADFLVEREVLREQIHHDLSISYYLRSYDKLCLYGLDDYFMDLLKWEINLKRGGDPDTFFSRDFELRNKDQNYMLKLIKSLAD